MLQVGERGKYRYLLFGFFALGTSRYFCAWGIADRGRADIEMRNSGKDRRWGCDKDGHILKVNRGVRTLFPLRWQPSPGSVLCHLAYDSLIKPILPASLSRPETLKIRGGRGDGEQ